MHKMKCEKPQMHSEYSRTFLFNIENVVPRYAQFAIHRHRLLVCEGVKSETQKQKGKEEKMLSK